jgi:hypothetical protein
MVQRIERTLTELGLTHALRPTPPRG